MTEKDTSISARSFLRKAFCLLKKNFEGKLIRLNKETRAEIANDSDWHRTRIGYMRYISAILLKSGDKEWIVAFGIKCGQYPADQYDCDITAINFNSEGKSKKYITEEVSEALNKSKYFRNSIVFSKSNGRLVTNTEGYFYEKVKKIFLPRTKEFVAETLVVDHEHITSDAQSIVISPVLYKKEYVPIFSQMIGEVLFG